MWSPTHIQVTVQRARGLLIKGKNATNNCFVTIVLGRDKYQTSIKEKASKNVDWHEECELAIPDQGNRAELILTCLHRNTLGIDEFLGQVILPLNEMEVYERSRSKWYKLQAKLGKERKKERGEIEVRILFIVKSGSLTDLSKKEKHKSSLSQLASSVGGSFLSLGAVEKTKGIKKFARSLTSKIHISNKSKKETRDDSEFCGSFSAISTSVNIGQTRDDADPGVISEDEDEFVLENLSNKSSGSSLNMNKVSQQTLSKEDIDLRSKTLPSSSYSATDTHLDEWQTKLYGKNLDIDITDTLKRRSWETSRVLPLKEEKKGLEDKKILNKSTQNKFIVEEKSGSRDKIDMSSFHSEQNSQCSIVSVSSVPTTKDMVFIKSKENCRQTIKPLVLLRSNTTGNLLESVSKESDNERIEKIDKKRFGKLKYFRKDKHDNHLDSVASNQFGERIIIGHENHMIRNGDKVEISREILKRYEGKSREEIILIANGLESEVCYQRQRVKELEDYLDNLLLRVMETQPKILQNPYDRNTSTKSG